MKRRKTSWRSLKFIPVGGDASHVVTRKDKGFMHLCGLYHCRPEKFFGYALHDSKGKFAKCGHNNAGLYLLAAAILSPQCVANGETTLSNPQLRFIVPKTP